MEALIDAKYIYPSKVQSETIPKIMKGKDLIVKSSTGTGKTASYVIPILNSLLYTIGNNDDRKRSIDVIILVPTYDLVDQLYETIGDFTKKFKGIIEIVKCRGSDTKSLTLQEY